MSSNDILEEAMKAAEQSITAKEAAKNAASVEIPVDIPVTVSADNEGLQEELAKTQEALAAKEAELEQIKSSLLHTAADFENFRKRSEKELNDSRKYGTGKVLTDFLPVMDNCERALEHLPDTEDEPYKTIKTGLQMIQNGFLQTLKKYGVEPIDSLGKTFDPTIHEALTQMPTDAYEPGQICQVYERGYMIYDRLLRAAKVVVAAAMPEAPAQNTDAAAEVAGE